MDLEFDKEIDSLLRKADRGVLVGDKPGGKSIDHLDADELAAFAENAMPEKVRSLHMEHLADCGRCRSILSGLILMNAEAGPETTAVAAPAIPAAAEPWYRRLLLFPNLAYVMGGLVLVFGGLLTFSLLQNQAGDSATVSQTTQSEAARGPMAADEPYASSSSNMNAATNTTVAQANRATTANSAVNLSDSAVVGSSSASRPEIASPTDADRSKLSLDGADAQADAKPLPPPPAAAPLQPAVKDEMKAATGAAKEEDKSLAKKRSVAEGEKSDLAVSSRQVQDLPRSQAGGLLKSTPGPSRDAQQNFPNRANNTFEMNEERKVGVRGFQRKNNVWYDNAYRGQSTINIRRGTDEYRKLDSGLRSIAESLGGVVVVVWEGKAYRIQ